MASAENRKVPPVAAASASIILGMIGLALFFLPILGTAIGACGMICGAAGVAMAWAGDRRDIRSAWIGLLLSGAALAVGFAIDYAPIAYEPSNTVPRLWQSPAENPYTSPPA